ANHASGYLFPPPRGKVISDTGVRQALDDVVLKKDVAEVMKRHGRKRKHIIRYSFRRTYATRALRNKGPVASLAVLMNPSVKMIQDHYGHLAEEGDAMRKFADMVHA